MVYYSSDGASINSSTTKSSDISPSSASSVGICGRTLFAVGLGVSRGLNASSSSYCGGVMLIRGGVTRGGDDVDDGEEGDGDGGFLCIGGVSFLLVAGTTLSS